MAPRRAIRSILLLTAGLALLCSHAAAGTYSYVEDFASREYCDEIGTTAYWDTLAGEIRLFPFQLSLRRSEDTPGTAFDVVVEGSYAYVADGSAGLQVMDIVTPLGPFLIGNWNTPGTARCVALAGDYAFLADDTSGLQILDISDPANPLPVGSWNTPGLAYGVAVAGDRAYVADREFGLQVIDISNPANPVPEGNCDTPGWALGVALAGDYAYVADQNSDLQVIDISDPSNPVIAGNWNALGPAYAVAIDGDHAFVAHGSKGLQVIDISDPTNPVRVGNHDTPGTAYDVAIAGDFAYVADRDFGLHMFDISDPTSPTLLDSYDTIGLAWGVAVVGTNAYVADYDSGLRVVVAAERLLDSNPITPIVGSCDDPWYTRKLVVEGNYAYATDDGFGLYVVDITAPTEPLLAGMLGTPGLTLDVAVAGDYAYLADGLSGLHVVDIGDPTNPGMAATFGTPGWAMGVAVEGDYAYVACDDGGLQVVDIADPTNPVPGGSCSPPGNVYDVAIAGDYAYLACLYDGLQVVDISDPTTPIPAAGCDTPGSAVAVVVEGDRAYVADGDSCLQVIDVADPTEPTVAVSFAPHDAPQSLYASDVVVIDGVVYLVAGGMGLLVLDVSGPGFPVPAGGCYTPGEALGIAAAGDYVYVADTGQLIVASIYQRSVDTSANVGQSLDVEPAGLEVARVRLNTTQTDRIDWEMSVIGEGHWFPVTPGEGWFPAPWGGSELLWRSTHTYVGGVANPICTSLTLEWMYDFPEISSIVDVPNDQGRQVSITWDASGFDMLGSAKPVTEYGVYRRIDEIGGARAPSKRDRATPGISLHGAGDPESPGRYPPGDWHFVTTVPARAEDEYSVVVPTLADSTIASGMHYSAFFVSALTATPSVYFDSPPDSGYSVDNLVPGVPTGFAVDYGDESNLLSWEESSDLDFQHFRIYRGTDPEFIPADENLIHMTAELVWVDETPDGWQYHYKMSAVDFSGNESDPAAPETVTDLDSPVPGAYALGPNFPNPFNPRTRIAYDAPTPGGRVALRIYDLAGRHVRTLVDGWATPGRHVVEWNGRTAAGETVAAGVYLYVLEARDFAERRTMVLLE